MPNTADNDNVGDPARGGRMRIYIFTSETNALRAFTDDASGGKLPPQFAPWLANETIAPGSDLPHRFARDQIEKAIADRGFQLWRLKQKKQ
jgi:hypothetical protein